MTSYLHANHIFIKNLRNAELQAKKEVKHYKCLYSKECLRTKRLFKECEKLKRKLEQLRLRFQNLHAKSMCSKLDKQPIERKRKSWSKVKCECTKCQRLNDYGTLLFKNLPDKIPQCKRAQLSLSLLGTTVNYFWKSNKCSNVNQSKTEIQNFSKKSDHSYASSKLLNYDSENEEFGDLDYSQIFDSEGNWQSQHKRCIINIMDSYRISHEAYHELRNAGKGHFPPLHQIRIEKALMSFEIPYIKHETVLISFFFLQDFSIKMSILINLR